MFGILPRTTLSVVSQSGLGSERALALQSPSVDATGRMASTQFKMGNAKAREKRIAVSTSCGKATEVGGGRSQSSSKIVKLSLVAPAPQLNPGCPCLCFPLELFAYPLFKLIFTSVHLHVYIGTTCMPGP